MLSGVLFEKSCSRFFETRAAFLLVEVRHAAHGESGPAAPPREARVGGEAAPPRPALLAARGDDSADDHDRVTPGGVRSNRLRGSIANMLYMSSGRAPSEFI